MNTVQIDILNPKVNRLLKELADLNLISIREVGDDGFTKLISKFRNKAQSAPPSLEEITKEVETVRANRYGKAKRQDHN
jgi:hypothetical protein